MLKHGHVMFGTPDKTRGRELIDPDVRGVIREVVRGLRPWPIFLHGETGSGKTCAVLCLIDAYGGWYVTLAEYCQLRIAAMKGELQWSTGYRRTEREVWESWANVNLAVFDELGMYGVSDFNRETLQLGMDRREERPSVYIANHAIDGIANLYGDRIASRLTAGTRIEMAGDRRVARSLRVNA